MFFLSFFFNSTGIQATARRAILIENGIQCNIANLPPLSLLPTECVRDTKGKINPVILESAEMEPFEDEEVDDEDYTPSIDTEEDEDETDEVKPQQ